jgi:hypothetical protein
MGEGHPPGLTDGRGATRHGDGAEVARSLEALLVDEEQFATPGGAVGAVAEAVVRHAEGRSEVAVLGEARRHVGVVVLHGHEAAPRRRTRRGAKAVEA